MKMEEILRDSSIFQWIFAEGEMAALQRTLTLQLTTKFGPLPLGATEKITAADTPTLNRWTIRILTATSIEDCLTQN